MFELENDGNDKNKFDSLLACACGCSFGGGGFSSMIENQQTTQED